MESHAKKIMELFGSVIQLLKLTLFVLFVAFKLRNAIFT